MKKVLFVCVHNSARSQMAEAFFNRLAKGKARAESGGTSPASQVNPVAVQAMREVGIDISKQKPRLLTIEMLEKADRVITMGCGADVEAVCPASFVTTEHWELADPEGKTLEEVRKIRYEIRATIEALAKEI